MLDVSKDLLSPIGIGFNQLAIHRPDDFSTGCQRLGMGLLEGPLSQMGNSRLYDRHEFFDQFHRDALGRKNFRGENLF